MKRALTPIQKLKMKRNGNQYYMKREDLYPYSFGGNKARKGINFFDDLLNHQNDVVVTYGSMSSNHARVIANLAANHQIPCFIIVPESSEEPTFNYLMVQKFGAQIIKTDVVKVKETIDALLNALIEKGHRPYFIEGGGHGLLGTQSYVEAYEEILAYEEESQLTFDYIFHTTGTGTTQAGLICGKIINGKQHEIIGISNARKARMGGAVVLKSVNDYLKEKGYPTVEKKEVQFIDDYILEGYGSSTIEIDETIRKILVNEGIPLDATYTGKGFWGMEQFIQQNNIVGRNVLFIHTGGTPLFFDELRRRNNE